MSSRIEKGYRLWGSDMTPELTPAECGMSWVLDPSKDFHGKEAAAARPATKQVVTLELSDTASVVYGWEPVLVGDTVVGRVAGGEYGYSVGAFLAHALVDPALEVGTQVEIQRSGVRHRAGVVRGPRFDPGSDRIRS